MENYNIIKNNANNRLKFKLSQIGYALNCDVIFSNRCPEIEVNLQYVNNLKHGDKIFICLLEWELTVNIQQVISIIKNNNIKVYFYLMYEPILPNNIIELCLPYALGIFVNNNVYEHPLVCCMPIGIRDCEKVVPNHKGFNHDYLFNEGLKTVEKDILCLMCYSYTHNERNRCSNLLQYQPFIKNLNDGIYEKQPSIHCGKVPVWINYEYTNKSYYTLSPRGGGEDCHRFYEAIYLNSTPIVKRTNTSFDKLYNIFPCLIVNDWNEVTEYLLLSKKKECINKLLEFKKKYPNAFTVINTLDELLLA